MYTTPAGSLADAWSLADGTRRSTYDLGSPSRPRRDGGPNLRPVHPTGKRCEQAQRGQPVGRTQRRRFEKQQDDHARRDCGRRHTQGTEHRNNLMTRDRPTISPNRHTRGALATSPANAFASPTSSASYRPSGAVADPG